MRPTTPTGYSPRFGGAITLIAATLVLGTIRLASGSPETRCRFGIYVAAGTYARCQLKATSKYYASGATDVARFQQLAGRCAVVHENMWVRLQRRALGQGSTCDGNRYIDHGNGTVTDILTGLQWEKKTDDGSIHDRDDRYGWSAVGSTAADGTVFTGFLAQLNGACFAGHCDWRLPTLSELQTILLAQYPAGGIDPIFGIVGDYHWTSTPEGTQPDLGWLLSFQDGSRTTSAKDATFNVRAVRGGL